MAMDRFLIAPFNTGLQTNVRPFLIMDDAFAMLQNAYVFRGRVRKRFGSVLMGTGWSSLVTAPLFSRLRINLGSTDGSGNLSGTVPGNYFAIGQAFSIGTEIFTVQALGTPVVMLDTGASATHTYNTSTGAFVFAGAAATTAVYFYPAQPVMGFTIYQDAGFVGVNNASTYAFDQQFAYVFTGGAWQRSGTGTSPEWHGSATDFFWAITWVDKGVDFDSIGALFVTNFHSAVPVPVPATDDPIWTTSDGSTWTTYSPVFAPDPNPANPQPFVQTARIIMAFKGHLVLLNTIENDNIITGPKPNGTTFNFVNRCRYAKLGSPFDTNAFYETGTVDSAGNVGEDAGFADASTEEQIISAEFIKDRLIVYFERSTWELAFTGNDLVPFQWQKINTELGSEALQSSVPFDKVILTIGQTGVHACNGSNVERIDVKIPDEIFEINDKTAGVERVAGIRDYFVEMVYWTFPASNVSAQLDFPNQVLVYNYANQSWSLNDDCITAFGYYEQQNASTWATSEVTWEESNEMWASGPVDVNFRQVVAGNQQGFTFFIMPDISRNSPCMQISQIATSGSNISLELVNHTLLPGDYIAIENAQGVTGLNGNIYKVQGVTDPNNVVVGPASFTGAYTGAGTVARVSMLNLISKQYNPYLNKGRNVYLSKIDFGVQKTTAGQITVDYYPSSTELSMITAATDNNMILGTGILETSPYTSIPLEAVSTRLWHPVYFQTEGECIQLAMSFSDVQIRNPAIAWADFELEGMVLHTMPVSTRLQ